MTIYKRIDDNGLLYLLQLLKPVIDNAGDTNVIEVIKKNGVALTVDNKTVNIEVPTDADIETMFVNLCSEYDIIAAQDIQYMIDQALADITGVDFVLVDTLPATGEKGKIYLVPNTGSGSNAKDEYIWLEPEGETAYFEKIGSTDVDLTGYVKSEELHALTNTEIDTIFNEVFTD